MLGTRGGLRYGVILTLGLTSGVLTMAGATRAQDAAAPAPLVVASRPISGPEAEAWLMLNRVVSLPFPNETPLQDVLRYLQETTREESGQGGLKIYVDPAGLTEVERTMDSPVQIDVEKIPLRTGLRLLLDQLDLAFAVDTDGLVVITTPDSIGQAPAEPALAAEVRELRAEVARLRQEVAGLAEASRHAGEGPRMGSIFPGIPSMMKQSPPQDAQGGGFR
jgi:hypothetical protein